MKFVPLTQGKFAMVSDQDWPRVRQFKWRAMRTHSGHWYAVTRMGKKATVYLHRYLKGFPLGEVDHRDRNGLNNTRRNLRLASSTLNHANAKRRKDNTSGYKGVGLCGGKWRARIKKHNKVTMLGFFPTARAAGRAYARAARMKFGEFARIQ